MRKSLSTRFVVTAAVVAVLGIIYSNTVLTRTRCAFVSNKTSVGKEIKTILGVDSEVLENSLALTPVFPQEDPFIRTYSLPLNMEVYAQGHIPKDPDACRGRLGLLVDGDNAHGYEFVRQKDGTYRVLWNTLFTCFGPHELRVVLYVGRVGRLRVFGPPRIECVTNLVRFAPYNNSFGSRAWIYGTLQVPTAEYKIEISDTNGTLLKTITGYTDKGVIDEVWDLKTEDGNLRGDEQFEAKVFVRPMHSETNDPTGTNTTPFLGPYPYHLVRIGEAGVSHVR